MRKTRIRVRITLLVGIILLVSNSLLVALLSYNFNVALRGFEVPINGSLVAYYFDDNFEAYLLIAGIIITILATGIGTYIVYLVLGKLLSPLKLLANRMEKAEKEKILNPIKVESKIKEVDILIQSFNSMTSKLRTMFENQAHFSSYVAHEFRTPLAIIQTNLDVYQKEQDPNIDEIIDLITEQISKLSKLVTQILNLVSITRMELKDLIPLDLVLDEVMDDLELYANEHKVTIEFTNEEEGKKKVETLGSHDLLYQTFFNLVENAIKYNKENGKVFINLHEVDNCIYVIIRDTGKGILEEDRDKIFNPFYRGDKQGNKDIKGNGVGLAFAKQVLLHHKGDLNLLPSKEGTIFEITLYTYQHIMKEGLL